MTWDMIRWRLLVCFALLWCGMINAEAFTGWVDPDTPEKLRETASLTTGETYRLVMSDEFERSGRDFRDGHDPTWTAIDRSDDDQTSNGRKSLQYYNSTSDYVFTANGSLIIRTTTEDTIWRGWNPYQKKYITMKRHFRSGMIQSWNKFCYTGGILEVSLTLPGRSDVGGLWPAAWILGNLGRATYLDSTNRLWPWSYEACNRTLHKAQEISGCDVTSHYNLLPGKGRGATEIDLVEVMPGPNTTLPLVKNNVKRPYNAMTLQVAPGIPAAAHRPLPGTMPEWGFTWYKNITYGQNTSINPFFYGTYLAKTLPEEPVSRTAEQAFQADAISSMGQLTDDHFRHPHTYRLEWQPGPDGYVRWYSDGIFRFGIEASSLKLAGSQIPNEPSYLIFNTAISTSWGFPNPAPGCVNYDCKETASQCGFNPGFCASLPAEYKIHYVRVYQNPDDSSQTIGCNPREYPTKRFIEGHAHRYKSATQKHPLKPVVAGNGRCQDDSQCGSGHCQNRKCKCMEGYTGPRCLVPSYGNPFPDWDVDHWIPLETPFIPSFLVTAFVVFIVAICLAAWYAAYKHRLSMRHDYQTIPIVP